MWKSIWKAVESGWGLFLFSKIPYSPKGMTLLVYGPQRRSTATLSNLLLSNSRIALINCWWHQISNKTKWTIVDPSGSPAYCCSYFDSHDGGMRHIGHFEGLNNGPRNPRMNVFGRRCFVPSDDLLSIQNDGVSVRASDIHANYPDLGSKWHSVAGHFRRIDYGFVQGENE